MQFLILAYDAIDDKAAERRMTHREAHLETIARYKSLGHMHIGAALLDEQEKMIGSVIVADFPSREALDQWLKNDPYTTGKVWSDVTVTPCRIAPSFAKAT